MMFVLNGILKAQSQEMILVYLLARERGYSREIASFFNTPVTPINKQANRLEEAGVIIATTIGRTKQYQLNPRYAFKDPLKELLKKALAAYPKDIQAELLLQRKRPRKTGKELLDASV